MIFENLIMPSEVASQTPSGVVFEGSLIDFGINFGNILHIYIYIYTKLNVFGFLMFHVGVSGCFWLALGSSVDFFRFLIPLLLLTLFFHASFVHL